MEQDEFVANLTDGWTHCIYLACLSDHKCRWRLVGAERYLWCWDPDSNMAHEYSKPPTELVDGGNLDPSHGGIHDYTPVSAWGRCRDRGRHIKDGKYIGDEE